MPASFHLRPDREELQRDFMARTDPKTNDTTESARDPVGTDSKYASRVIIVSLIIVVSAAILVAWSSGMFASNSG